MLAVFVVLNSGLSAFYYLRPIALMYMAEPIEYHAVRVPPASAWALVLIAVFVGLGVLLAAPVAAGARSAGNVAWSRSALEGPPAGPLPPQAGAATPAALGWPPRPAPAARQPPRPPANRTLAHPGRGQ